MKLLSTKLILGAAGLVLIAGAVTGTENLVKNGSAENIATIKKWHKNLTQNNQDKITGESSFQGNTRNICASSSVFLIDPTKTYKLSGSFKSIGKDKGLCFFGLAMYTSSKRAIQYSNIVGQKGSIAELAEDAKVGDTILKISDCSKWNTKRLKGARVAFGAKEDYSDLPNYELSNSVIKLEKKDNVYEITLKSPLKKNYPAGTKVRQHYSGGRFQYCATAEQKVPEKWTKYSAILKGTAKSGVSNKQFWPGTKFVKVIILVNYRLPKGSSCKTLFDDISFVEVD